MRSLAISLLFLTLGAATASAQSLPKIWHLGLGGGVNVPVGDASDSIEQGFNLQGVGSLALPGLPMKLRASLNYGKFNQKVDESTFPGVTDATSTILSGLGNAQFSLIKFGPIKPYVSAGLGAFSVGSSATVDGESQSDSEIHFGINGAAGAELKLGSVIGYVEARFDNIYTDQGFSSEIADPSSIQFVPVVFGIMF
jgi:hypothetical protein